MILIGSNDKHNSLAFAIFSIITSLYRFIYASTSLTVASPELLNLLFSSSLDSYCDYPLLCSRLATLVRTAFIVKYPWCRL